MDGEKVTELTYIDSETLLLDSFRLARQIWESGYRPDFLVGLWRGGTPPGIAIHEFFRFKGHDPYHTAIKTQSYQQLHSTGTVEIKGLNHVVDVINSEDKLLFVDDVFDTGTTVKAVIEQFKKMARKNTPEIRVAVIYYKPQKRKVDIVPDFFWKENNQWLVFPHELDGLTTEQIRGKGEEVAKIILE